MYKKKSLFIMLRVYNEVRINFVPLYINRLIE